MSDRFCQMIAITLGTQYRIAHTTRSYDDIWSVKYPFLCTNTCDISTIMLQWFYLLRTEDLYTQSLYLLFKSLDNCRRTMGERKNSKPVRRVALDSDLFEKCHKIAIVQCFQSRGHKSPFPSEAAHKCLIVQCIGQVTSTAACRLEFGTDTREFLKEQNPLSITCRSDRCHHTCRAGAYDDEVIHYGYCLFCWLCLFLPKEP